MKLERIVALTSLLIASAVAPGAKALPIKNYEHERVKQKQKSAVASEFVIGAFPGPPDDQINLTRYRQIAEAGCVLVELAP